MLTEREKILIHWMKAIGMSQDDTAGVIMFLDTPEKQDKLARFLSENREVSGQEVLREMNRIIKN